MSRIIQPALFVAKAGVTLVLLWQILRSALHLIIYKQKACGAFL